MIVRGRTPRSLNLAGRVAIAGVALGIVPLLPVSAQESIPPVDESVATTLPPLAGVAAPADTQDLLLPASDAAADQKTRRQRRRARQDQAAPPAANDLLGTSPPVATAEDLLGTTTAPVPTQEAAPIAGFADALFGDPNAAPDDGTVSALFDALLAESTAPQDAATADFFDARFPAAAAAARHPLMADDTLPAAVDPLANPFAQQGRSSKSAVAALQNGERELAQLEAQLVANRSELNTLETALADLSLAVQRNPNNVNLHRQADELAVRMNDVKARVDMHSSLVATHRELVNQLARAARRANPARNAQRPAEVDFLAPRAQAGQNRVAGPDIEQSLNNAIALLSQVGDEASAATLALLLDQLKNGPAPVALPGMHSYGDPGAVPTPLGSSGGGAGAGPFDQPPAPTLPRAAGGRGSSARAPSPGSPSAGRNSTGSGMGRAGRAPGAGRRGDGPDAVDFAQPNRNSPSSIFGGTNLPSNDERMDRLEVQMQSMQNMMQQLLDRMEADAAFGGRPESGRASGGRGGASGGR